MIYFLACIQIIIESLPISSSGHVALGSYFLQTWGHASDISYELIADILYGPTVLVLLFFFFFDWWQLVFEQPFSWNQLHKVQTYQKLSAAILFYTLFSIIFLPFYFFEAQYSLHSPLYFGFVCTQFCLAMMSRFTGVTKKVAWSFFDAFIFALANGIALYVPGVSRLGMSMFAGVLLGYTVEQSFVFSWMLFLPMALLCFVKGLVGTSSLLAKIILFDQWWWITIACATVGAWFGLYLVRLLIRQEKIYYLAWYMCIPILLSWYVRL